MKISTRMIASCLTAACLVSGLPTASADTNTAQATYNKAHASIVNQDCHALLYGANTKLTTRAAAAMPFDVRTDLLTKIMDKSYPGLVDITDTNGQRANAILAADLEKRFEVCNIVESHGDPKFYADNDFDYSWLYGTTKQDLDTVWNHDPKGEKIIQPLININRAKGVNPPASIVVNRLDGASAGPGVSNNPDNHNNNTDTPNNPSDADKLVSKLMTILSIVGVIAALLGAIHQSFPNLFPAVK